MSSSLPSRKQIRHWRDISPDATDPTSVVCRLFYEGRLVDREAIDREAAAEVAVNRWKMLQPAPLTPELKIWLWALAEGIVAAALGDTHE